MQTPELNTYAITQKDYLGIEYTRGFILAADLEEARARARGTFGPTASARPASHEGEVIRCIDDLVNAENDLALARMLERRAA